MCIYIYIYFVGNLRNVKGKDDDEDQFGPTYKVNWIVISVLKHLSDNVSVFHITCELGACSNVSGLNHV